MRFMSFKDLLAAVELKGELEQICRTNEIPSFSRKDRAGLEEWVFQTMNNKQYIKDLLGGLPGSAVILLDQLLKNSRLDEVKASFLKGHSSSTYYVNLRNLTAAGILFTTIKDEQYVGYIPTEFKQWIKEFIKENSSSIEVTSDEPETASFKDFDSFVWSGMIPIEILRVTLEDEKMDTTGTKMTLIHRLFYEKQKPREEFLGMFGKDALRLFAETLELPKSGTKEDIISRIIEKLPLRHSVEEYERAISASGEESDDETVTVETPTTLLKLFMSDAIPRNRVKEILTKRGLDAKGSKPQVVKRLLEESRIPISDILNDFNVYELKDICTRYGLKRSLPKPELIDQILTAFNPGNLNLKYSEKQASKATSPASTAYKPAQEAVVRAPKPKKAVSKGTQIFELLKEELNDQEIWTPESFSKSKEFTDKIRQSIVRWKKSGTLNVEINPVSDVQDIIEIDGKDVLIFCSVITTKNETRKESVQVAINNFNRVRRGYSEVIALIWDRDDRLLQTDERLVQGLKEDTNGLCLIKKISDFSSSKGSDDDE